SETDKTDPLGCAEARRAGHGARHRHRVAHGGRDGDRDEGRPAYQAGVTAGRPEGTDASERDLRPATPSRDGVTGGQRTRQVAECTVPWSMNRRCVNSARRAPRVTVAAGIDPAAKKD